MNIVERGRAFLEGLRRLACFRHLKRYRDTQH